MVKGFKLPKREGIWDVPMRIEDLLFITKLMIATVEQRLSQPLALEDVDNLKVLGNWLERASQLQTAFKNQEFGQEFLKLADLQDKYMERLRDLK